jgi:hypothetical protein
MGGGLGATSLGGAKEMIKLNRPNIIPILLFVCILFNCSPAGKPVQIKKTYDQQRSWALDYLDENVLSCRRIDDSIAFRTTAKLGIGQWGHSWNQNFLLAREGGFIIAPDHHLKVSFSIASIDSASVLLKYEYQFDHRSFGKELISIDTGEVRFNYK